MREDIVMNAVCSLLALGAIAVAVWAVLTGQVGRQGLDGVFLLGVCLSFAMIFGILPAQALRRGSLRRFLTKRKRAGRPAEAVPTEAGEKRDTATV